MSNYRLHGLGVTQTQDGSAARSAMSQKDNTPASSWDPPGLVPNQSESPALLPGLKDVVAQGPDPQRLDMVVDDPDICMADATSRAPAFPDKSHLQRTKTAKAVASIPSPALTPPHSPQQGTTRQRTMRERRQGSLSPIPSDDSFIEQVPLKLQYKRFIETTGVFHVPLSQLGQTQGPDEMETDERSADLPPSFTADMYASLPKDSRADSCSTRPDARNDVLVAGTPSNTSSERSALAQSYAYPSPLLEDSQEHTADESTDPVSAQQACVTYDGGGGSHEMPWPSTEDCDRRLHKLWDEEMNEPLLSSSLREASQNDCRPVTLTQPSTPIESQPEDNHPISNAVDVPATATTNATASGAKSILAMVDPRKVSRYQAIVNKKLRAAHAKSSQGGPTAGPSNLEATQPTTASNLPATGQLTSSRDSTRQPDLSTDRVAWQETQPTEASNLSATGHESSDTSLHSSAAISIEHDVTQPSVTSNIPATGQPLPHSTLARPSDSQPYIHEDYEETQPSNASALPPTGTRIAEELAKSPYRPPQQPLRAKSSYASDSDVVPDSEPTQPESEPARESSPEIPLTADPVREMSPEIHLPSSSLPLAEVVKKKKRGRSPTPPKDDTESEGAEEETPRKIHAKEEEEESSPEEESDEVPLAAVTKKQKPPPKVTRGKRARATSNALMPPPTKKSKIEAAPMARTTRTRAQAMRQPRDGTEVIPTSEPQERSMQLAVPVVKGRRGTSKAPPPKKVTRAAAGASRLTPRPVTPVRSVRTPNPDESEDDVGAAEDGDARTEPDDAPIDVKAEKAKRILRKYTTPARHDTATPGPFDSPPTRVFALWIANGQWYSGYVKQAEARGNSYSIQFDDGHSAALDGVSLRRCELNAGDSIWAEGSLASVVADTGVLGREDLVKVKFDDPPEGTPAVKLVTLDSIYISSRAIQGQWNHRKLAAEDIVPQVKPRLPTGSSVKSLKGLYSPADPKSKIFARTGFVITWSTNSNVSPKSRDALLSMIRDNGGSVLQEWSEIFSMKGRSERSGSRWVWTKNEVKFLASKGLQRVFLLADEACMKPKYLIALGLGIPCLSYEWVDDCVTENKQVRSPSDCRC